MKVSGIGCVFRRARPDLIRRYLRQAVATFGADRCMFGSNCPPDTLFYRFGALVEAYQDAFSTRSAAEQHDIFCGTALRVYRLLRYATLWSLDLYASKSFSLSERLSQNIPLFFSDRCPHDLLHRDDSRST
jgi:hypothetical protein